MALLRCKNSDESTLFRSNVSIIFWFLRLIDALYFQMFYPSPRNKLIQMRLPGRTLIWIWNGKTYCASLWWAKVMPIWPSHRYLMKVCCLHNEWNMMTSSNGIFFSRYWPFVRGIHRSPVNSPHKGQWRGALMFYFICAWINGSVNNREAGDLRHHLANYDVIVMSIPPTLVVLVPLQGTKIFF